MEHQISRIIAEFEANALFREKILPIFYQEEILSEEDRQQYNESADEYYNNEEMRDRRRNNIVRKIIKSKQRLFSCRESVINKDPEVYQAFQKIKVLLVRSYRNFDRNAYSFKTLKTPPPLARKAKKEDEYLPEWTISSTLPTCSGGLSKSEERKLQKLRTMLNQANLSKFSSLVQVIKDEETVSANILYKLCYYQANQYLYTSERKKCSKLLKTALSITGKTSNPRRFDIELFSVQAWLYLSSNKMGKCYNAIQNALQLAMCDPASGIHKALGWVYYFKSSFYATLSDSRICKEDVLKFRKMAKDTLTHAIDQFQREKNKNGSFRCGYCYVKFAKLLLGCGRNLQTVNSLVSSTDIEEAYLYIRKVENLENGVDNVLHIAYDQALSDYYYRMGNYQRAHEKASEALKRIRKYGVHDDENEIEIRVRFFKNLTVSNDAVSNDGTVSVAKSFVDKPPVILWKSKRKCISAMIPTVGCKRRKYDESICNDVHLENA